MNKKAIKLLEETSRCLSLKNKEGFSLRVLDLIIPLKSGKAFHRLFDIVQSQDRIYQEIRTRAEEFGEIYLPWEIHGVIDRTRSDQKDLMIYRRRILNELYKYGNGRKQIIRNLKRHLSSCDSCLCNYLADIEKSISFSEDYYAYHEIEFDIKKEIKSLDFFRLYDGYGSDV